MTTAKIQTVKGLRVEIFLRFLRKNTIRPLTVWIGGTGVEQELLFVIGYGIISTNTDKSGFEENCNYDRVEYIQKIIGRK
ncbi:hypothetical protein IMSAGC011_03580 [Lachnospiraceae bacterium]|nr:hypothetical protein IMSAGC011_03580 [Lachnospiraceae bacterium]